MSYDVDFCADMGLGNENPTLEEGWRNYTSNVSGMWSDAIGENKSLGELIEEHRIASELLPYLERGIGMMAEAPEHFRAMNPTNGWGDYEGALAYLVWMRDRCKEWPTAWVYVSR